MGKQTENQLGSDSIPSWSPNEESTFLNMLVEEFINKQPEAMDALIALVLFRISKITDEGWNRVAIRLTERMGKKYTMMELKEQMKRLTQRFRCIENLFGQGGPGMSFPGTTFEPYSEDENDARVFRSPDENVPTPKKDDKSSDGYEGGVEYPEDCTSDSNRSSGEVPNQEDGPSVKSPSATFEKSLEHENDAGISRSPVENNSLPETKGRNSDGCNGSVLYSEESVRNSERSYGNVCDQDSGPSLDVPTTIFEPFFEYDNDAGAYWTPDVSIEEDGPGMDSPNATSEPYFEHYNGTGVYWSPDVHLPYTGDCVRNSYRSSDNGSHQDISPGTCESPIEKISIPEKEVRNSDGCNDSVPYIDVSIGSINRSCANVSHQEGGPGTSFHHAEFVPSDEHESDAGICQSPIGSVLVPEKDSANSDGCNGGVPSPEESIRNFNRYCGDELQPQEDVDSGVTPIVSYPRECENTEENVEYSGVTRNVSYPRKCTNVEENVEDSGLTPNVSFPRECTNVEENVKDSAVNHNVYHSREFENATETAGESEQSKSSDAEKNCGSSTEGVNVSSPLVNGESVSQWYEHDTATQQEDAPYSTPIARNKRLAADPLDLSGSKKNKWSSYSEAKTTCGVGQNPDDGDSFSLARCRNILQGMRRIDSQFRDNALNLLEDPYYRKFFMQMKYDKRLDWLSSILGMKQ